jgi:NTE family protein
MMGGLLAAGVPPWFMVAHSAGETFTGVTGADGRPASEADRSAGAVFRLHRGLPPIGPGSWRLALASLRAPRRHTPIAMTVGWLPRGFISTESLQRTIRRVVPSGWVDHQSFWAVACDYADGRRVAFGHEDAPRADMYEAVAASCAIPGFYHPVPIGARRYVDGGVRSASNLDLLANRGLDLVICLNPTSSLARMAARRLLDRPALAMRAASGRRLGYEAKRVRAGGTEVVLIQPVAADLAVMGNNLMNGQRRHEVIETAIRTVTETLAQPEIRDKLSSLPKGEPHKIRRPAGDPSSWPELVPGSRRRAA